MYATYGQSDIALVGVAETNKLFITSKFEDHFFNFSHCIFPPSIAASLIANTQPNTYYQYILGVVPYIAISPPHQQILHTLHSTNVVQSYKNCVASNEDAKKNSRQMLPRSKPESFSCNEAFVFYLDTVIDYTVPKSVHKTIMFSQL